MFHSLPVELITTIAITTPTNCNKNNKSDNNEYQDQTAKHLLRLSQGVRLISPQMTIMEFHVPQTFTFFFDQCGCAFLFSLYYLARQQGYIC